LRATASPTPGLAPKPIPSLANENYVALQLIPDSRRGANESDPSARLPVMTRRIKLTLLLDFAPVPFSTRATLRSKDGAIVVTRKRLPIRCNGAAGCSAIFDAVISNFKPGSYQLRFDAIDEEEKQPASATYNFQLTSAP
jgi:hypothetical protein